MLFNRRATCHRGVFSAFSPASSTFRVTCQTSSFFPSHHKKYSFQLFKIVKHPSSPPSGNPPPLLAVKIPLPRPVVILHPFWRSNSPFHPQRSFPPLLPVKFAHSPHSDLVVILLPFWWSNSTLSSQQSFSTPSPDQIHPSPSSGHPPPLLAVKFPLLSLAVISTHGGIYGAAQGGEIDLHR